MSLITASLCGDVTDYITLEVNMSPWLHHHLCGHLAMIMST